MGMNDMGILAKAFSEGLDDDAELLHAARAALRTGMHRSGEGGRLVQLACDVLGPEMVYMDGELVVR